MVPIKKSIKKSPTPIIFPLPASTFFSNRKMLIETILMMSNTSQLIPISLRLSPDWLVVQYSAILIPNNNANQITRMERDLKSSTAIINRRSIVDTGNKNSCIFSLSLSLSGFYSGRFPKR